jgi:hypothetical protein
MGRNAGDTNISPVDDATGALRNPAAGIDLGAYDRNAVSTNNLTNGLVAYYPFQGNFLDYSGRGNDCINYGASFGTDRFGNPSNALSVTLNSYAVSKNNLGVSGNSPRTMSLWFNTSTSLLLNQGYILGWGVNGVNNMTFVYTPYFNPNATLEVGGQTQLAGQQNALDGNVSVSTIPYNLTGNWHNVIFTYSGSTLTSCFYLDGKLQTNNFQTYGSWGQVNTIDTPLNINGFLYGRGINGYISNVRIYNRALTTNEVSALYQYESTSGN